MSDYLDCHKCRYRAISELRWDRSRCTHPEAFAMDLERKLGIEADRQGLDAGEFNWPEDFDPKWLRACKAFTPREEREGEAGADPADERKR